MELELIVDIRNIWDLPSSPVFGYIVGSARPLRISSCRDGDVDQILNVANPLTTVKVEGTVADYKATISALTRAATR